MPLSAAEPPPAAVAPVTLEATQRLAPAAKTAPDTEVTGIVVSPPKSVEPPAWSAKLNLDPRNLFQSSETPYLRQRPVDDCKPMAGGARPGPNGRTGFAAGLVCVKRF